MVEEYGEGDVVVGQSAGDTVVDTGGLVRRSYDDR
ncbi:hypothetical protein M878_44200 [Streptomyces roseochromogenus subsp. oscitans DS 12.976]|uniref:Uncharacterized protein n=1 Tax=Streptomyces roseochromogenus subsp. oscitans DS 12.976 TaxID=1352936 RepID=V6JIF0_STRRC|nr:hypothetical protein M878_44200 [Streptomyces roseochromogenus subsp. oscitans DS 12.976]